MQCTYPTFKSLYKYVQEVTAIHTPHKYSKLPPSLPFLNDRCPIRLVLSEHCILKPFLNSGRILATAIGLIACRKFDGFVTKANFGDANNEVLIQMLVLLEYPFASFYRLTAVPLAKASKRRPSL